ncbi:MAG: alanine racemase, partial [Oscillospiraceae bacterium]
MKFEHRCFAEVDLDILDDNLKKIKAMANGAKVLAVVKADAYGHGFKEVCQSLEVAGADFFAVSNIDEAAELRAINIKIPILILGYTDPRNAEQLAQLNITQAVYSSEYATELNQNAVKANVKIDIHIKLDTGMGRIGFCVLEKDENILEQIKTACTLSNLNAKGIFTHFADADSLCEKDTDYTEMQYNAFMRTISDLAAANINFEIRHCCNSAGILLHKNWHLDMVRAGIILYGCPPSPEVETSLRPALQMKATVSLVKNIKKGQCVSYGSTFVAPCDMRLATVTAGYADGYPRNMSNCGIVAINGCAVPVVGRVCMDQFMVDVTNISNVQTGDIVTLYGDRPA